MWMSTHQVSNPVYTEGSPSSTPITNDIPFHTHAAYGLDMPVDGLR